MITMEIPQLMAEQYREAKKMIEESEDIKVYSHIDCDGICSGAILSTILDRQNKAHEIEFVNLDVLDDIDLDHELTIFSDLGSGQRIDTKAKKGQKIIILDHHPPLRDLDYKNNKDYTYLEINPLHHGIDGLSRGDIGDDIGHLAFLAVFKHGGVGIHVANNDIRAVREQLFHNGLANAGCAAGNDDGLAFQIQDDILDFKRDNNTGKPSNNDLREHKITLPLIEVMERGDDTLREEIIALLKRCDKDEEAVDKLHNIVEEHGGKDYAAQTMQAYIQRAMHLLAKFPDTPYRESLLKLCAFIAERDR